MVLVLLLSLWLGIGHAAAGDLCAHGFPVARSPLVTYGGLPVARGFERDHVMPLCLGGADTADNVRYQEWGAARRKDAVERFACQEYCAGRLTLEAARRVVRDWDRR